MFTTESTGLVYSLSRWERYNWQEFKDLYPDCDRVIQQGAEKVFSFPDFASEVFHRLYSNEPSLIEQPRPEAAWAVRCHQQITDMPEFIELEQRCRGDRFLAGMAATAFCGQIAEKLPTPPKPLTDPQQLRDQIKALKNLGNPEMQSMLQEMQEQGKAAVGEAQQFTKTQGDSAVRVMLRGGCEAAEQVLDSLEQAMGAYGWGDGFGSYQDAGNLAEKMAIAQRIAGSKKLQAIAALAGRLKQRAAIKQRSKAKEAHTELSSVELGNDLARLLPTELINLGQPELWPLFAKGYVERSLQQYMLSGKDTETKGPVVVCLDSSGSMQGQREVWSKAVALALLAIATHQKRHCRILHFNAVVQQADDFPVGQSDPSKLLASMQAFFGGGTSWEAPLNSAIECIRNENSLKKADIILVTDGKCHVSDHWLERFSAAQQELEFTVYGALVGSAHDSFIAALNRVANKSIVLPNLSEDGAIDLVFEI